MKEIMKNKEVTMSIKCKPYNTHILLVVNFGCQARTLTKVHTRKWEVYENDLQKSLVQIKDEIK